MECFSENNFPQNSYKLSSNITLNEEKKKLKSEAREQCCFCLLFSGAAAGSSVVACSSHGSTLPADIPSIIVSISSAGLCFTQVINKVKSIHNINKELEKRNLQNVKYVDNFSNLSVYCNRNDSLHPIHHPVL